MTECAVICRDCPPRKDGSHQSWHYLCEDCARNKQAAHYLSTDHDTELKIGPETTMAELQRRINAYHLMSQRPPTVRGIARW